MTNIKKTLLYYWYVHPTGWNEIYNFHIKNLKIYKDVFDNEIFIISRDDDTKQEYIDNVKNHIIEIFPNVEFREYKNDKELRESFWFYNEIALKLKDLPDAWYFFAHNKGVDTWYTSKELCYKWIAGMYFMNLHNVDGVESHMSLEDTCVIGTYLIRNVKAWSFLKYNWHFSGTYWWFNPHRVYDVMIKNNNSIPINNRYFTEGFFGSVIPDEERYRRPALMRYDANWRYGFAWMNKEMQKTFAVKYQSLNSL